MDEIVITIDVEWASDEVLRDTVKLLNDRNLQATFFCTHACSGLEGHERAIHPNFRTNGDISKSILKEFPDISDLDKYRRTVSLTKEFCSEAVGVRSHCLFYDSEVLKAYNEAGIKYDSSYFMPFVENIRPFWKEHKIIEIPFYYMDHIDLVDKSTQFRISDLELSKPGLKVFDFHPNMIFINSATEQHYIDSKHFYHDAERLKNHRHAGQGVRTLFIELIDYIAEKKLRNLTLAELAENWIN